MSFRRSFIILSALFIVLLCLFVLGLIISPSGTAQRTEQALLFPGLMIESVARIEIGDSATRIVLSRAGAWTIDIGGRPFPASQESVDSLLKGVSTLTRGSLVTRSSQTAASLGLGETPEKTLVLADTAGNTLCSLRIGKSAAGGQGFYAQAGGKPEVWRTGQALSSTLTTRRAHWADLHILPADVKGDSIISLSVSARKGPSWTVTRERDAKNRTSWVLSDRPSSPVQQEKLTSAANAVAGLVGSDFLIDASPLSAPAASVTVLLADNRVFTVIFGEKDADGRYGCSLEKGQYSYLVPEWRVKEILLDRETITSVGR